jgi:hypothetical protein
MKKRLSDNEFENRISEVFKAFIGLCVTLGGFVEHTTMDTSKNIKMLVLWENLERGEEFSHFRFKLHTIIAK